MGYYMYVEKSSLQTNGLETLPEDISWTDFWEIQDGEVKPNMRTFKWDDAFEEDLVFLARSGVTGEIELCGEQGDWTRYVLENRLVKCFEGSITYPDEPTSILGEQEHD